MWRAVVGLAVGGCLSLGLPASAAGAPASPKPPSAAQMKAAQSRANAAAARLAKARSALARSEREVTNLQARSAATQGLVSSLEGEVRQLAVHQYMQGGREGTWVGGDPGQAARGRAMLRFLSLGRTDSVEGYRVARLDLEETQTTLTARLNQQKKVVAGLRREEAAVSAELARLAAAQKAYQAKVAAEKAAAARSRRASRSNGVPGLGLGLVLGSGDWICPVQGPHAFSNDWGQPRSGGRTHQGNDIMAARGTPIVANVAGSVKGHNSDLGGISYYLKGNDGNTYFGTHLDRLSGASGNVAAGTVIGFVGSTGNASPGAPHLHFEIHPGGGAAVNPFATLSRYC